LTSAKMVQSLLKRLSSGDIEEVDIRFTDVLGYWRHVTIPTRSVGRRLFSRGIGFDGSTLEAMTPTEAGDLAVVPDPRRVYRDPFARRATLVMIADIVYPESGKPFSRDPRGVARKAAGLLKEMGLASGSFWAPEFEFYLLDEASFWNRRGSSGYRLSSIEDPDAAADAKRMGLVHPTESGYHASTPVDSLHDVRSEIAGLMQQVGMQLKYHHHEVGQLGQTEIEVKFAPFLSAADNIMITKHLIRGVALKYGLAATFMPKPAAGEPGNGMHYHLFFQKGDEHVFFDKEGYCCLSPLARSAIAGILHHAPAVCAFTNASTNSYRRLQPNQEAPVYRFFSGPNRSAAVRVPAYARTPESMRFEYRVPDATGNPHLSMAAMLMAAIDGVKREMVPEEMGFGPIDDNVFAPGYDTTALHMLPRTLDAALDALEADREFLQEGDVFAPDLIDAYMETKRAETARFRGAPHPLEHKLYFGM